MNFWNGLFEIFVSPKTFLITGILGVISAIALGFGYFSGLGLFFLIRAIVHLVLSLILFPFCKYSNQIKSYALILLIFCLFAPVNF